MAVKQTQNQSPRKASSKLAALVGVPAALILFNIVPEFEGTILYGYLDPVGILTKCAGDTTNVELGKRYSEAHCFASLERQLLAHAEPVLKCTPSLAHKTYELAAAVSFAYNVGAGNYCGSDAASYFRAGDYASGCRAISENEEGKLQWVYAKGKILPGLVTRRKKEREICERGLL